MKAVISSAGDTRNRTLDNIKASHEGEVAQLRERLEEGKRKEANLLEALEKAREDKEKINADHAAAHARLGEEIAAHAERHKVSASDIQQLERKLAAQVSRAREPMRLERSKEIRRTIRQFMFSSIVCSFVL